MSFRPVLATVLLAVALAVPAVGLAQSDRGNITGVVRDTSKGVVPGVSVKVVNTATNATTEVVSSETGTYTASNLPPGIYRIEATLAGFKSAVVNRLVLAVGATATADVTLDLGSVSETVTVEAKANVVADLRRQGVDQHAEQADRRAAARRRRRDAQRVRPGRHHSGDEGVREPGIARRWSGRSVRGQPRRHLRQHQPRGGHDGNGIPHAVGRSDHGVLRRDQRIQTRVRAGRRRRHHIRVQVRHQQVPGIGVRIPPRRLARRQGVLRETEGRLQAAQLRCRGGRPHCHPRPLQREGQVVLLRVV